MGELKSKTLHGMLWNGAQRFSATGIQFLFMIFMTRLLSPSDYGIIGMLAVFMEISSAFIDCGFGQAIIRKQNRTKIDESTVFYFNVVASVACWLILFAVAPFVAVFYKMPELCSILRVLSFTLVISSLSSMHVLDYMIKLDFKTQSIVNVLCSVFSGIGGIIFAYNGFGVWALVWQRILSASFITITYWFISSWHPIWAFSYASFREMFGFGSKLLGSRLLNSVYANIAPLFIGRYYTSADLGLYSKAQQMISFPNNSVFSVVDTVSYPVLCRVQSERAQLTLAYRKFQRLGAYLMFPVMVLLTVLSRPLIVSLFGAQWVETAFYMSLLCLPWMLVPIQCNNLNLLKVVGKSNLIFRLEIIGKVLGIIMLLITLPISIYAMCYGTIVVTIICFFINAYYTSRYVDLSVFGQLRDLFNSFALSIIAGSGAYLSANFLSSDILKVVIGGLVGVSLYVGLSYILKIREYNELMDFVRNR